jgi:methanogenic corrinoid protein MtbC1
MVRKSLQVETKYDTEGIAISFLILADDFMFQEFKNEKKENGTSVVGIELTSKRNIHNIGKDLIMGFKFYFPSGHSMFKTVIYGDNPIEQKMFIEALTQVNISQ